MVDSLGPHAIGDHEGLLAALTCPHHASHTAAVLGVKSHPQTWHSSLLVGTSCTGPLPVARMFPALPQLMAFAWAVPFPACPCLITLWLLGCSFRSHLDVTPRDPWLLWPRPYCHPWPPQPGRLLRRLRTPCEKFVGAPVCPLLVLHSGTASTQGAAGPALYPGGP